MIDCGPRSSAGCREAGGVHGGRARRRHPSRLVLRGRHLDWRIAGGAAHPWARRGDHLGRRVRCRARDCGCGGRPRNAAPPPGLSFTSASSCWRDTFCLAGWEDMSRQFFRLWIPCWSGHRSSETSWMQPGLSKHRTCLNTAGKANGAAEATGDQACSASGTREARSRYMREGSEPPCLEAVIEPYSCRRHAGTVVVNRGVMRW